MNAKEIKNQIDKIIEIHEEESNLECYGEIEEVLKSNGIEKYQISIDGIFESAGYDVYSITVAWWQDGEIQ